MQKEMGEKLKLTSSLTNDLESSKMINAKLEEDNEKVRYLLLKINGLIMVD